MLLCELGLYDLGWWTCGSMTEPALEQLLAGLGIPASDYPAHQGLVAIQRWLDYFLPAQYQTTQDSIKIIRATNL